MFTKIFYGIILFYLVSCNSEKEINLDAIKAKIEKTENNFNKACTEKGIDVAFYEFAAENAVIKRENDSLISGKENIKNYYSKPVYETAKVSWKPDKIEVSDDGTMASTFGKYKWIIINKEGKETVYTGIFHTVWKKQKDNTWKYIWD